MRIIRLRKFPSISCLLSVFLSWIRSRFSRIHYLYLLWYFCPLLYWFDVSHWFVDVKAPLHTYYKSPLVMGINHPFYGLLLLSWELFPLYWWQVLVCSFLFLSRLCVVCYQDKTILIEWFGKFYLFHFGGKNLWRIVINFSLTVW